MPKKVLSEFGEINVAVPMDRNGEFEPRALRKGIGDKILALYAKGMSIRDIS